VIFGEPSNVVSKNHFAQISVLSGCDFFAIGPVHGVWIRKEFPLAHPPELHPDDNDVLMSRRHPERRDEFLRARRVLYELNHGKPYASRGRDGEPLFPGNWIGSLSHKDGDVVITAADRRYSAMIGVDIEKISRVSGNIAQQVCTELEWHVAKKFQPTLLPDVVLALIFSAKEALFKAHRPHGKTMFYFYDAVVTGLRLSASSEALFDIDLQVLRDVSPFGKAQQIFTCSSAIRDDFVLSLVFQKTSL